MHGDDFVGVGRREDARWLKDRMEERFEIKTKVVGIGEGEEREGKVLNRAIRVAKEGWEYEADQRHGGLIVNTLNLQDARGVLVTRRGGEGVEDRRRGEETRGRLGDRIPGVVSAG